MAWRLDKSLSKAQPLTDPNNPYKDFLRGSICVDVLLPSMAESVKEDMRELRACPYFKKDVNVLGYVFDLENGSLAEVKLD